MKHYVLPNMKPSTNDFYSFTKEGLSEKAKQSLGYKAVLGLFRQSERHYRILKDLTNERLTQFVDAETYLSERQERDIVALTAHYIASQDIQLVINIVEQDAILGVQEKVILKSAAKLFQSSAVATMSALGNPVWVDKVKSANAKNA